MRFPVAASSDERVGKETVADAIGAVPIGGCGADGDVHDAARCIDGHAAPVVGCAGVGPDILGPGFVAEFAGVRDGTKGPAEFAGVNIVGADVSRGAGTCSGVASPKMMRSL